MYKSQRINLEKLFSEALLPSSLYEAWEQAMIDTYDCWGTGSDLLMYDDELHNSYQDELKVLTEIVLKIQEKMDKRGIKHEKIITKPHKPQYVNYRSY